MGVAKSESIIYIYYPTWRMPIYIHCSNMTALMVTSAGSQNSTKAIWIGFYIQYTVIRVPCEWINYYWEKEHTGYWYTTTKLNIENLLKNVETDWSSPLLYICFKNIYVKSYLCIQCWKISTIWISIIHSDRRHMIQLMIGFNIIIMFKKLKIKI